MNRAHKLIENFMIAANVCMTRYFTDWNLPVMRRIVKTPKRWSRIVQLAGQLGEHLPAAPQRQGIARFSLQTEALQSSAISRFVPIDHQTAGTGRICFRDSRRSRLRAISIWHLRDYAHTTAPNRRFPDLGDAASVEEPSLWRGDSLPPKRIDSDRQGVYEKRRRRGESRAAAHQMRGGDDAGPSDRPSIQGDGHGRQQKGTWVRITNPPIEGRLTHGFQEVDVGDWIEVQLIRVDIHNGHIDFRRV